VRQVAAALQGSAGFVGGHPIAGTEHAGMEAAQRDLFKKRWWIFTPRNAAERKASRRLASLVRALGAKPLVMSPEVHDEALALFSHLPHMLAYALMQAVLQKKPGSRLAIAGSSFRDATRVAASSAEIWSDICLENRRSLLDSISAFDKQWTRLKQGIARGDAKSLRSFFESAARLRRKM